MSTPKSEHVTDVQKTNRVIQSLRAALCKEEELSSFVRERTYQRIQEINDRGLYYSASSFFYFTINDIDKGVEFAEKAVSIMKHDTITWRQYVFCKFWTCGAIDALAVARRAMPLTHSPQIAFESAIYAVHVCDYDYFLEQIDFVNRTGKLEDFMHGEIEGFNMKKNYSDAMLAKKYNKIDELHNIASIMYEQLTLKQKLGSETRLLDVSDEDEKELLFEMAIDDVDSSHCANMNLELIGQRIKKGCTDWSVGGVFVNSEEVM